MRVTLKCSEGRQILMRKAKQLTFVMGVICQIRIAVNDQSWALEFHFMKE